MTVDALLDGVLKREGGYQDNPTDRGNLGGKGATNFGITSTTLGAWRRLGRPANKAEVRALQESEARAIYRAEYVRPFEAIPFDELKAQLVDIGITSSPHLATTLLQTVLGVKADGVLGERTLKALMLTPWTYVNDSLVAHRCKQLAHLAEKQHEQRIYVRGWINRAVQFTVLKGE